MRPVTARVEMYAVLARRIIEHELVVAVAAVFLRPVTREHAVGMPYRLCVSSRHARDDHRAVAIPADKIHQHRVTVAQRMDGATLCARIGERRRTQHDACVSRYQG